MNTEEIKPFNILDIPCENGEAWKEIKGYKGVYFVSTFGRVFSNNGRKRYRKPRFMKDQNCFGYSRINITNVEDSKQKKYFVHRLVAGAFIPNPNKYPSVNHKDGNKQNNKVYNLEWVTFSENSQHAIDNKLHIPLKGSNHPSSKLTGQDVIWMRENQDKIKTSQMAEKFNIRQSTVWAIIKNKRWKHI